MGWWCPVKVPSPTPGSTQEDLGLQNTIANTDLSRKGHQGDFDGANRSPQSRMYIPAAWNENAF